MSLSAAVYPATVADGKVTVTVHRLFGSRGDVTVNYANIDGTASAPTDYTTTSGTLTWLDGDTTDKTFDVLITNEVVSDWNESFNVTLSSPTGYSYIGAQDTATISIAKHHGLGSGRHSPTRMATSSPLRCSAALAR
jgi:hypothetical protein